MNNKKTMKYETGKRSLGLEKVRRKAENNKNYEQLLINLYLVIYGRRGSWKSYLLLCSGHAFWPDSYVRRPVFHSEDLPSISEVDTAWRAALALTIPHDLCLCNSVVLRKIQRLLTSLYPHTHNSQACFLLRKAKNTQVNMLKPGKRK